MLGALHTLRISATPILRRLSSTQSHVLNREQFSKQAEPFARVAAHSHEQTLAFLLDTAGVRPGTRLVDVACGPGLVSLAAAERGAFVTGVDVTPACVAAAEAARARRGVNSERANFRVAAAEALPFEDGAFDVALSRYAFHHIARGEARVRAIAEMARVVRGGGLVIVCDVLIEGTSCAQAYDSLELLRDNSHAGVIEGGRSGGNQLVRSAGLELVEGGLAYDFEAIVEDVVAASFPDSPAAAAEFVRRIRDSTASSGGSTVSAAASPLGIAVDATNRTRTKYKVPIGIWVGRKLVC
jgi:ubiquinone/menaquinone biosynthesis C-methylase UbiE